MDMKNIIQVMDFINDELEEYKDFAKQLYEREMF